MAIVSSMRTLGDDIVLLALRPDGRLAAAAKLRFALSGAELVGLAEAGRVGVDSDRIVVLDSAPTGDPLLDAALEDLVGRRHPTPPRPRRNPRRAAAQPSGEPHSPLRRSRCS